MPFVTVNKVGFKEKPFRECPQCQRMLKSFWFPTIEIGYPPSPFHPQAMKEWQGTSWRRSEICRFCLAPADDKWYREREAKLEARRQARREFLSNLWGRYSLYHFKPSRRRQLAVERATPLWADSAKIQAVYEKARLKTELTGIQHHVDHIVPVISQVVCGLHVPWNLRVLTAKKNMRKGNKLVDKLAIAPVGGG